jgi:DNA-directed RNA polymerase subunit RPC12/RpoP
MKCPKCSAMFGATPDEIGRVECPQCGARLRSKGQAVFKARGAQEATKPPPGGRSGERQAAQAHREPRKLDPDATLRRADVDPGLRRPASPRGAHAGPATLETLLAEVRIVRKTQEEILSILKGEAAPRSDAEPRAANSAEAPASGFPGQLGSKG